MQVEYKKEEIVKQVISLFENIYPLSQNLKDSIFERTDVISVKKKEKLLDIGETSKYIFFIAK